MKQINSLFIKDCLIKGEIGNSATCAQMGGR